MQGLGDGYFILPYTIGNYFVSTKQAKPSASHPEFKKAEADVRAFTNRLLSIKRQADGDCRFTASWASCSGRNAAWRETRRG